MNITRLYQKSKWSRIGSSRIPACRLAGISGSDIQCVGILKPRLTSKQAGSSGWRDQWVLRQPIRLICPIFPQGVAL